MHAVCSPASARYVPRAQGSHAAFAVALSFSTWYPGGQVQLSASHGTPPSSTQCPARDAPAAEVLRPEGHGTHSVAPKSLLYVLTGHRVQLLAPLLGACVPAAHAEQLELAVPTA
jgi:hypothetical protein